MPAPDATTRFSSRVRDYVRYRPGYPPAVLEILRAETGLSPAHVIADVGAGTGISTRLFLDHGNVVHAVEPNAEMRAAAEVGSGGEPRFRSVDGTAEATGMPDASVDFAVAGQAFHWFDAAAARREFRRILRPGGWAVLMWNTRRRESSPFLIDYEALLRRYGTDYATVNHENVTAETLRAFFGGAYAHRRAYNEQVVDFDGIRGRLLSSSYAPAAGHPDHAPMLAELERIFAERATDGHVVIEYDVDVYFAQP